MHRRELTRRAWRSGLRLALVVGLILGLEAAAWACYDCERTKYGPCSLAAAFFGRAYKITKQDDGEKYEGETISIGTPHQAISHLWELDVTVGEATECFWSSQEGGPYQAVNEDVKAWVEIGESSATATNAEGWTATTASPATLRDPSGKILLKQTDGDQTETVQEGKDTFIRTLVDGQVTHLEQLHGETAIRETYFKYTEDAGEVLVRKRITVEDYNSDGTERFLTAIYVYYGDGDPYEGKLWFVIEPEGVRRYLAEAGYDQGIDPDAPGDPCGLDDLEAVPDEDDEELELPGLIDYADVVYSSYDAESRVTGMTSNGSGCCGASGPGTYTFLHYEKEIGEDPGEYPENPTEDQKWNLWKSYRRTTHPSGLCTVEFYNMYDQVVFEVVQDMSGSNNRWVTHYVRYYYDSEHPEENPEFREGLLAEHRYPSACAAANYGLSISEGWVTNVTPSDTGPSGLVRLYDYHNPSCKLLWEKVRQGTKPSTSGGNDEIWVRKLTYTDHTWETGNPTIYLVDTDTRYPNETTGETPSGGETTEYDYTSFYADSNAVKFETVKHPTVSTDNNGSGSQTEVKYHYKRLGADTTNDPTDDLYYNDWTEHEDGTLSYTELGTGTWNFGQVVETIVDANYTDGEDFPDGLNERTGGFSLTTTYAYYDATGSYTRLKSVTIDPGGDCERKTVYAYECQRETVGENPVEQETTTALVTLVAPHMDSSGNYDDAPVQITVADLAGRTICSAAGDATTDDDEDGNLANDWDAGEEAIADAFVGTLCARTDSAYNGAGQLTSTERYYDLSASKKLTTSYTYGTDPNDPLGLGRRIMTTAPEGTISYTVYDQLGRVTETWMGTDATDADQDDPSNGGQGAGGNNMKQITATEYDDGGVGNGNVTQTETYYDDSNSYDTVFNYDYRDRLERTLGPDKIMTFRELDNLGRAKAVEVYANVTDIAMDLEENEDLRWRRSETAYDKKGQVYKTIFHEVNRATGSEGNPLDRLTTKYWYDSRGRLIKTRDPNGLFSKTKYDGAGRTTASYLSYDDETAYADADDVDGDTVVEQTLSHCDDASNVWLTRSFQRHDGASGEGELTTSNARVTYTAAWFDELGRTMSTVFYGTNEGGDDLEDPDTDDFNPQVTNTQNYAACQPSGDPDAPNTDAPYAGRSANTTYLATDYFYEASTGRQYLAIDNKGAKTRAYFDDLGRTTKTIENYVNDEIANDEYASDRTTEYEFDSSGRLVTLTAYNPKGVSVEEQQTCYLHDSDYNRSWPTRIVYPDSSDDLDQDPDTKVWTIDSGDDHVSITYDRLGRKVTLTDQRDVVHAYTFDSAGRLESDDADTPGDALPASVDNAVVKIGRDYDDLSRLQTITSYNSSDAVVNEVRFTFDAWGNVKKSIQDHANTAVEDSGDPTVTYTYDDNNTGGPAAVPYVRLDKITYPGASREVYYNYGTAGGTSDVLSRLDNLASTGTNPSDAQKYAQYTYLGAGTIVQVDHPAVAGSGLTLSYKGSPAGSYAGFDRFGRIVRQKWTVGGTYFYGYDRNSNRLWRADLGVTGRDEAYAYDGLDRLVGAKRGTHPSDKYEPYNVPYPGDATRDGAVNALDYVRVSNNYGLTTSDWEKGEMNGDGTVNALDYVIVSNNYGTAPTVSLTAAREWSLETLGNWREYKEDAGPGGEGEWDLEQDRAHNKVNEVDGITGGSWIVPEYDMAGNMIFGPKPGAEAVEDEAHHYVWDAWNRLVEVWEDTNEDGDPDAEPTDTHVLTCRYDGLGRRIQKTVEGAPDVTYDYYYNASWQIVEVHRSDYTYAPYEQYVWDIRYIDAPVLRDRDTVDDGTLDETLYFCNDANMNVTALVDTSGAVVERYAYDPYGQVTILNGADGTDPDVDGETVFEWDPDADGVSDVDNHTLYAGYHFDTETGLYSVRHRTYHPTLGRWPSRDPGGYADGMSLYEYVRSRPNVMVDPMGRYGVDVHWGDTAVACWQSGLCGDACLDIANANWAWDDPGEDALSNAVACILGVGLLTGADKKYDVHFPGAGPPTLVAPQKPVVAGSANNSAVRGNIDKALESCDVEDIGRALHALQDSYAHQGQPSCGGHPRGREITDPDTGEPRETEGLLDRAVDDPSSAPESYDAGKADMKGVLEELFKACCCELCPPEFCHGVGD